MDKREVKEYLKKHFYKNKKGVKFYSTKFKIPEVEIKKIILSFKKEMSLEPYLIGNKENVLIIGDTHIPFERKGYLEHCRAIQEQFDCGTVIHIGDVIDNHYSSYHESDPDGYSAGEELQRAVDRLKPWYYTFPEVKVCLGNHDELIHRRAFSSGLSKQWIKGYSEVLEIPNWRFAVEHEINNVLYTHGTGTSGENAAYNKALNRRKSVVQGHIHTVANIKWNVSENDRLFALQVGCGIDDSFYAFNYARGFLKKSIISCAVVLNSGTLPIILPMEL
jgi:predicted phosphodiesterase